VGASPSGVWVNGSGTAQAGGVVHLAVDEPDLAVRRDDGDQVVGGAAGVGM